MAVTKQQKTEILADLVAKIKDAKSIGFASSNTLTVKEFDEMRKSLREVDASYTLAKKTLMVKAVKDTLGLDINLADLPGQIGLIACKGDAIAGLGKVNDFIKKTKEQKVVWALSIFDGEVQNLESTKAIAWMPSRETLLGRLVGSIQSPLSGLARFFDAAAKELETTGKEKVGKLEGKKETVAPAPETPSETAAAPEAPAEEVSA